MKYKKMKYMRNSFIFYRSFYEAIKELDSTQQSEVYNAIFEYSLNFKEIELKGISSTIFKLIKPQLDANNKRFANGTKGGKSKSYENNAAEIEPNNNQNETKTEPKQNQTLTKTEANNNDNDNDNDNDNNNYNVYENSTIFFNFRNSIFKDLPNEFKDRLKAYGITKPQIRSTNNMHEQYIDVVDILYKIDQDKEWQYQQKITLNIDDAKFVKLMKEFIKKYVGSNEIYNIIGFKNHFFNWSKKQITKL